MFRLSRKAEYALRTVLYLSTNGNKVCTTEEIAKAQDIPIAFLKKIIQVLRTTGIITSAKGQNGGVLLSVPPEDLSVREVIEKVEGPLYLNSCLVKKGACNRDEICPLHEMWRKCQNAMMEILESHNLDDLAGRHITLLKGAGKWKAFSAQSGKRRTTSRDSQK